jgi:YfiH family protein
VTGKAGTREVHWVEQVHGRAVVTVANPAPVGQDPRHDDELRDPIGEGPGDGLVSSAPSVALAVLTADCASVALGSPEGVFAAVHAGWRGLVEGVVDEAVGAMRALGATGVVGKLGPCVHAECYEFSASDLDSVCAVVGDSARGRTAAGRPALDVPAAVSATLAASGVTELAGLDRCTACGGGYFSHRARGDLGRQALLVWSAPAGGRPAGGGA